MIVLLLSSLAWAQPGRTTATSTLGLVARTQTGQGRGTLDHGLSRRLSLSAELGAQRAAAGWTFDAALAPMLELWDGQWWRLSATAMPALTLSTQETRPPGLPLLDGDMGLVVRTGVRANWLAFWGLSFVGRLDRVFTLDDSRGWTEAALGVAVRM